VTFISLYDTNGNRINISNNDIIIKRGSIVEIWDGWIILETDHLIEKKYRNLQIIETILIPAEFEKLE
jgi:hypothetical protein